MKKQKEKMKKKLEIQNEEYKNELIKEKAFITKVC